MLPLATTPVILVIPEPIGTQMRPVPSWEISRLLRVSVAPPLRLLATKRLPFQFTVLPVKENELVPVMMEFSPLKMRPPVASVPRKVWAWLACSTPPLI